MESNVFDTIEFRTKVWSEVGVNSPTWLQDLPKSDKEILEIESIWIPESERGKGMGTDLINKAISKNEHKIIIALAGALAKEYKTEPSEEELIALFSCLDNFYTKLGFVDVNSRIGRYTSSRVYMYVGNQSGKDMLSKLEE